MTYDNISYIMGKKITRMLDVIGEMVFYTVEDEELLQYIQVDELNDILRKWLIENHYTVTTYYIDMVTGRPDEQVYMQLTYVPLGCVVHTRIGATEYETLLDCCDYIYKAVVINKFLKEEKNGKD